MHSLSSSSSLLQQRGSNVRRAAAAMGPRTARAHHHAAAAAAMVVVVHPHRRRSRTGRGGECKAQAPQQADTSSSQFRQAGPPTPPPDYSAIDAAPLNRAVMALFRAKMVAALGSDSEQEGYAAIIDLTRRLNRRFGTARETQIATRGILKSLFPSWLPGAFAVMFSRPLPGFSCRLNAFATALTCQWLMGNCKVNDVDGVGGGGGGAGMGVLVERCRYLEEAGCASVCINSCKVPTQEFFARDMGLPLTMEPNYDDFSCQFKFGAAPPPVEQDPAFKTACFAGCPTKGRAFFADGGGGGKDGAGECPNIPLVVPPPPSS